MKGKKLEDYKRVNIRDERIPVEIRKAAYFKWAEGNGISKEEAKKRAELMFDNIRDERIPVEIRKAAYFKWAKENGVSRKEAEKRAELMFNNIRNERIYLAPQKQMRGLRICDAGKCTAWVNLDKITHIAEIPDRPTRTKVRINVDSGKYIDIVHTDIETVISTISAVEDGNEEGVAVLNASIDWS